MDLALTLVGVGIGLVFGGLAGYRTGRGVRGNRGGYWALNIAVVLGCAVLDFAGLVAGRYWLAYAAIGLMAGLITGMKYGFVDSIAVMRVPESADEAPELLEDGVIEALEFDRSDAEKGASIVTGKSEASRD